MYALYREIHPPTAVEHCVSCSFLRGSSGGERNLVTAAASYLRVYKLKKARKNGEAVGEASLEQVLECQLFGNVTSMAAARLAKAERDALLLAFGDAKLSVVDYDPESHDLRTVSLHYFEDEESKLGKGMSSNPPLVRVDPDNRCAAMLIHNTRLAILPFQQDELARSDKKQATGSVFPSYIVDLTTVSDKVAQVRDIQFLYGYNKPTLCVLYETVPTWAGRVHTFKDTYSFLAVTLDTSRRLLATVWTQTSLPFNSTTLLPVPKPLGGVLVFTVNSLIYFSQGYPHFGVSTNSMAEKSSNFSYRSECPSVLTLDGCRACFMSPGKLLLTLRNGQMYLVGLVTDSPGMDLVRNISFDLTAASVQASCVCKVGEDFVFLGSRLGNSLLLHCSKTVEHQEPPSAKRRRTVSSTPMDELELELFGNSSAVQHSTAYSFKVCDSVLNTGPISSITMGEPAGSTEEEFAGAPPVELVACCGYGKNGALCALQRGVRPQVVTSFGLPGHSNLFTLLAAPTEGRENAEDTHAYLLLSSPTQTMVLQTGDEIAELDQSGFSTQETTVWAGNIGQKKYNVQVTRSTVVLLEGATSLQELVVATGPAVLACSVADPFMVLLMEDGSVQLLTVEVGRAVEEVGRAVEEVGRAEEEEGRARLVQSTPQLGEMSKVVCVSAFVDTSGMFTTEPSLLPMHNVGGVRAGVVSVKQEVSEGETPGESLLSPLLASGVHSTLDDEDEMLYGSSTVDTLVPVKAEPMDSANAQAKAGGEEGVGEGAGEGEGEGEGESDSSPPEPTHWCALCCQDGSLKIVRLPEFTRVLEVAGFTRGPRTLKDTELGQDCSAKGASSPIGNSVRDLLLVAMGPEGEYPHIMTIVDQELLVYRALPPPHPLPSGRLQLQFVKQHHQVMMQQKSASEPFGQKAETEEGREQDGLAPASPFRALLRTFTNISGYSGVFLCGPLPHWMLLGRHGAFHTHPMYVDGSVECFASFNNQNCPSGFLYFNQEGEMRICVLPSHLAYHHYWPVHKVPLKATPHFIAYHPTAKVHALITGESFTIKTIPNVVNDDIESMKPTERDHRFPFPTDERFQLQLFLPSKWESVSNCSVKFDDFEHVTCMKVVSLRSAETVSGKKHFIVLSTCDTKTEEVSSKGKVCIYDVVSQDAAVSQVAPKMSIKLVGSKELKSPVTALEAADGQLLGCVCQKIYIWQFKDKEITAVAFIDTDMYIHTVCALKNFILIADVMKNVKLLRYRDDLKTLSLISKDPFSANVYSVGFAVDGDQLGFIAADGQGNISIYQYDPDVPDTFGGRRLLRRCDLNSGTLVSSLFRLRCQPAVPGGVVPDQKRVAMEKKHVTYFATLDGGLGFLLPVQERVFRRLNMLQAKMVPALSHSAGLNPRAFRQYQSQHQLNCGPMKNFLDGELIWQYAHLSAAEKTQLAKQIGTEVEQIQSDLSNIMKNTCHF